MSNGEDRLQASGDIVRARRALLWGMMLFSCAHGPPSTEGGLDDRRLIRELTPAEGKRLCDWVTEVARWELPADGHPIECDGEIIPFSRGSPNCDGYLGLAPSCEATVGDVRACSPRLFKFAAVHPCRWMRAPEGYDEFIRHVPECARQNACRYADEDLEAQGPADPPPPGQGTAVLVR